MRARRVFITLLTSVLTTGTLVAATAVTAHANASSTTNRIGARILSAYTFQGLYRSQQACSDAGVAGMNDGSWISFYCEATGLGGTYALYVLR